MSDKYNDKSEEIWNSIAESFDATRRKPWKQCIDFISKLSEEDLVIDMCCGNGRHLVLCAEHCKTAIGIDISRKLLAIVKKEINKKNMEFKS